MRTSFSTLSILPALVAIACAPKAPPPSYVYEAGDRQGALEAQQALADTPSREQALDNLRLGSMALAMGNLDLADKAFRRAVGPMTNFVADGEFAAVVGSEDKKEWKGEPYEKMAAFFTLGTLLYEGGDRGNALAMYKSAVLADTGTAEERFRSDFVPAWVLQGLVYQAEGETDNARQFMARGVDSLWSRHTIEELTRVLERTQVPGASQDDAALARAVLLSAMSGGVTARPRDPQEAVRATLSVATDLLKLERDKAPKERLPVLQGFKDRDFERAAAAMPALSEAWAKAVTDLPPSVEGQRFSDEMDALLAAEPNVVLVVERGAGPRKVRTGEYGEILQIVPSKHRATEPRVTIDGAAVAPTFLDSLSWQATTRGGRGVDGFLHGKAVYKDTSFISGYLLLDVADSIARNTDNDQLAAAMAIAGGVLMVTSALTNPAADIRQWELAPDAWYLVAGRWQPGDHSLVVGDRTYTLKVPETGQVVGLVPRLDPGGPAVIGH